MRYNICLKELADIGKICQKRGRDNFLKEYFSDMDLISISYSNLSGKTIIEKLDEKFNIQEKLQEGWKILYNSDRAFSKRPQAIYEISKDLNFEVDIKNNRWNKKWLQLADARTWVYTGLKQGVIGNLCSYVAWLDEQGVDTSTYRLNVRGDFTNIKRDHPEWIEDVRGIKKMIDSGLKNHKQIVLTGAPGTGKTYSVRKYVEKDYKSEDYKFVQFHPSYDYTDFVEGLRPVMVGNSMSFVRVDGTFKKFCRHIVEESLRSISGFKDASPDEKRKLLDAWYKIEKKESNDSNSYTDEAAKTPAETELKKKYFFIIDEINRADLSKVFGELMFGLEESYRGIANRFPTQYAYLPTYQIDDNGSASPMAFDCFKDGFFIPKNLYIIGTMNDIDKSVEAFDFALRRRFEWIEVKANDVARDGLMGIYGSIDEKRINELAARIINMNKTISKEGAKFGLSEAYHIGHAYFKNLNLGEDLGEQLEQLFDANIASILREYLRGRNSEQVEKFIKDCKDKLLLTPTPDEISLVLDPSSEDTPTPAAEEAENSPAETPATGLADA